jgi:hypothetical protein
VVVVARFRRPHHRIDHPFFGGLVHSQGRTRHSKASRPPGFDLGEAALDLVVLIPDEPDDVALPVVVARAAPVRSGATPAHRGETLAPGRVG